MMFSNMSINTQTWEVRVTIDQNIETSLQQIPLSLIPNQNRLSDLLYAVSTHEFGHNQNPEGFFGCPGDEEYFKKIVEGIRDALEELKVADERRDQLVPEIANCSYALNDKEREPFKRGMSSFYVLNSSTRSEAGFPQLFGQYVDLQLRTFWREGDIREYARGITNNYSDNLARDLFRVFSDSEELTDKLMKNTLSRDDELNYYEELNDKKKWNLKAYEFTKKIYHLLDSQQPPSPDKSDSKQGSSGGSGSEKSDQNQEQQGTQSQRKSGQKSNPSGKQGNGEPQKGESSQQGKGKSEQGSQQQGDQSSRSEQQGQDSNTGSQYKPSDNYFTNRYKNDTEFRQQINDEIKRNKDDNMAEKTSIEYAAEANSEPGKGKPKGFTAGGSQFGGMGKAQPSSMSVGFRMGRNSGFSEQDLEQIFQQPRRERYDIPEDFLPQFKRSNNGEIDLRKIYDFFEQLAEKITLVPPKEGNDEVSRLPIGYLQRKRIERMGQAPLNEMDWGSTMHMPNGEWSFFAKQCPLTVDEEAQPMHGSTKDICFIGDVSGSMGYVAPMVMYGAELGSEQLQGHDNFLAMVHSVIKDIKEKQMGYHLKYSGILFSNQTRFSGWHSYYDLDTLLEWMYGGYEGGGTKFNADVLKRMYDEASDKFLTIMLTDGAISNAEEAAGVVGQIIKNGNEFVLIEYQPAFGMFGRENESQGLTSFGNYVQQLGGEVHPISKIEDLFKITLSKARGMY